MKFIFTLLGFIAILHVSIAQVTINRYSSSQISTQGIIGKKSLDKEIIINEIDVDAIFKKWEKWGGLNLQNPSNVISLH